MGVAIYRREFEVDPSARGHHVVYRLNESNRCPGCGHAQWLVGRVTAECVFCGTAVALAEAQWSGSGAPVRAAEGANRRRHERTDAGGRTLQLLIDGSPQSFALDNISSAASPARACKGCSADRPCSSSSKAASWCRRP